MYFDQNRATLIAQSGDLDELAEFLASPTEQLPEDWIEGGLAIHNPGNTQALLNPTVVGIVEIMAAPVRSIVIERFDGQLVTLTFVAFDRRGRATVTEGVGPSEVSVTATDLSLLPALLAQSVRLGANSVAGEPPAIPTTVGVLEHIFSESTEPTNVSDDRLRELLGSVQFAWRASGSWPDSDVDSSITVVACGELGLWSVAAESPSEDEPSPAMPITLTPTNRKLVLEKLGDVVTGRSRTPNE